MSESVHALRKQAEDAYKADKMATYGELIKRIEAMGYDVWVTVNETIAIRKRPPAPSERKG